MYTDASAWFADTRHASSEVEHWSNASRRLLGSSPAHDDASASDFVTPLPLQRHMMTIC